MVKIVTMFKINPYGVRAGSKLTLKALLAYGINFARMRRKSMGIPMITSMIALTGSMVSLRTRDEMLGQCRWTVSVE